MVRNCGLILFALLLMASPAGAAVATSNNNFTMLDPGNNLVGGTNDVVFTWDGTLKSSVAVSGQVPNATISSSCPFSNVPWTTHDVAIYGPGSYTIFTACPAGSPGCGAGAPISFTVGAAEIGVHLLLDWNGNLDMDVVNVMKPNAAASTLWTGGCGGNSACTVWAWTSYDFDGDGVNGTPIVDGMFAGMSVNFNLGAGAVDLCCDAAARCNDFNACTVDSCDPATGACLYTAVVCNDNNACTTDTCDPATGCQYSAPITCQNGVCDPATGNCVSADLCADSAARCNDHNACTTDTCDPLTGVCRYTPIACDDDNPCTIDTCDPAIGCVFTGGVCFAPVYTVNNNLSIIDPAGVVSGGANDVTFTWDGTLKTSVASSGQIANATIGPFYTNTQAMCTAGTGTRWYAHDAVVYGSGFYTVYSGCPAGSPGCGTGVPIAFAVGADEFGVHLLLDWGSDPANKNIDVVNVWKKNAVFGPSPLWTGACGSNPANKVWELTSKDPGTGINGYPMVDGPFTGARWNFNMMGAPVKRLVDTFKNSFTMNQPDAIAFGGTNDVRFTWDGTLKTSVAASGQVSNASISSPCTFFGQSWWAHDVAVYGPGTYTVYTDCPAGSPGCGAGVPYTFTVKAGEIGGHMLFLWNANENIDVVNVWTPKAAYGPSPIWTGGCGSDPGARVWDWMSSDWDGDGINGSGMVDGPFQGMNANFNLMGLPADPCFDAATRCNDNNACTTDTLCDPATGACIHTTVNCDDGNVCTVDSCDPATGCVHATISCDDNNACTTDTCDPATGCIHIPISTDDHDACTIKTCNPITGVDISPINCDDKNSCTTDTCNPATGCVHTPISCNDNNACTTDSCNAATGCVYTLKVCNDNNPCTSDSCDAATGCVYAPVANGTSCAGGACQNGTCTPITSCPRGSHKTVYLEGTGQTWWTEDQIVTRFTVVGAGCILHHTDNTITATPGTVLQANWRVGWGPQPSFVTWKGTKLPVYANYTINCPATTGTVGSLVLDNKANHGKDSDTLTVIVATK